MMKIRSLIQMNRINKIKTMNKINRQMKIQKIQKIKKKNIYLRISRTIFFKSNRKKSPNFLQLCLKQKQKKYKIGKNILKKDRVKNFKKKVQAILISFQTQIMNDINFARALFNSDLFQLLYLHSNKLIKLNHSIYYFMQLVKQKNIQQTVCTFTQIDLHISLLEHLKRQMKPQKQHFDIIKIFQIVYKFCQNIPNQTFQAQASQRFQTVKRQRFNQNQQNTLNSSQLINKYDSPLKFDKFSQKENLSNERQSFVQNFIQQRKTNLAIEQLSKLKNIFLYFSSATLSYELINEYMMNNQMKILKNVHDLQNKVSFTNLSDKRVRLDENVKLCIMPQGDASKIKSIVIDYQIAVTLNKKQSDLIFKKNDAKETIIQNQRIFTITNQYIRKIQVNSDKLHNSQFQKKKNVTQASQTQEINLKKDYKSQIKWYKYAETKIKPKPLQIQSGLKLNAAKQTIIQAVSISSTLIGFITYDRQFLVQPQIQKNLLQKRLLQKQRIPNQIKFGHLIYDIPDQNLSRPIKDDPVKFKQMKQSKIILFQNYDDDLWIVANQQFIYVYRLPLPNSQQFVNDETQKSSLLTLCQPLPTLGFKAVLLSKQYMAIMLEQPCVLILKLQLSGKPQLWQKNRIYPTNKIYNDIKFICMEYHPIQKYLMFTDFGGYIMRLKFNITNGDLQRQGKVYDQKMGKFLTANTTNTKRQKQFSLIQNKLSSSIEKQSSLLSTKNSPQLLNSSNKKTKLQHLTVWNNKGSSFVMNQKDFQFNLVQIKNQDKKKNYHQHQDKSGLSIYSKPENTEFIKVVKNNSRQNMILLAVNKDFSTVITYQQISKTNLNNSKTQNQKDYLFDKTIKLWDIHNLTVYQTFKLSLQVAQMRLQFNGLYIVTKQKGYLGFYPFLNKNNEQQLDGKLIQAKNKNSSSIQQLEPHPTFGLKLNLQDNQLYFTTELQSTKNKEKFTKQCFDQNLHNFNSNITCIYKLTMNNSPTLNQIQQIPEKITNLSVKKKMYVLADINSDKRFNCHIYNKLGVKQAVLNAKKYENFNNIKKITHFQFNILFWNSSSLKFLGDNLEQSLVIYWSNSPKQQKKGSQFDNRSMSSLQNKLGKRIQNIFVGVSNCAILQKLSFKGKSQSRVSFFHLDSGRIKYQISKIPVQLQFTYLNNNLFICKQNVKRRSINNDDSDIDEQVLQKQFYSRNRSLSMISQKTARSQVQSCIIESQQFQYVNLYDLKSPNQRKCIFTLKYKKKFQKSKDLEQISSFHTFNPIVGNCKFFIKTEVSMKCSNLYFNKKGDQLVLTCLFQIKSSEIKKTKSMQGKFRQMIIKTKNIYVLYSKCILSQIQKQSKYKPKSDIMTVTKLSNKHNLEYMCEVQSHERVLGHWEVNFEQLKKRSNITNWTYKDHLHYNRQPLIGTAILDLTQILQNYKPGCRIKFQNKQCIFQFPTYQQTENEQSEFSVDWIQNQIVSNKNFISFSKKDQILLFCAKINLNQEKGFNGIHHQVKLVTEIQIKNEKPIIKQWNSQFQSQNNQIWQNTKKELMQLIHPKSKLNSQISCDRGIQEHEKQQKLNNKQFQKQKTKIIEFQKLQNQNIKINKKVITQSENKQVHQIKKKKTVQITPEQMNSMFKQWQISKQIQKQKDLYQKNNTDQKNQLQKYIKKINLNPQLRQKRIKQLLNVPANIKRPKVMVGLDLIGKTLAQVIKNQDVFSILTKQFKNIEKNNQQNSILKIQEELNKKLQNSIQKNKKDQFNSYLITDFKTIEKKNLVSKVQKSRSKIQNRTLNTSISDTSLDFVTLLKKKPSSSLCKNNTTQLNQILKKQSQNESSVTQSQLSELIKQKHDKCISSSVDLRFRYSKKQNSSKFMSTNPEQSPLKLQSIPEGKQYKGNYKRCRTQTSQKSAIKALQESQLKIKSSVLPKITQNRQRLLQKMKQKKSFIKLINQHLDKSHNKSIELQELKALHMKKKKNC